MKAVWSMITKILFVLVLIQAWFLYELYNKNQGLIADNVKLEQELLSVNDSLITVNDSLIAANKKIEVLEKNSLEGVLQETNKAVVNSWESLLDTVEGELEKARKSIDSTIDNLRQELPADDGKLNSEKKAPSTEEAPNSIKGERT
jgi:hypothetical protein